MPSSPLRKHLGTHDLRRLFLEAAFRTDYYRIDITFNGDDSWTYVTRTDLAVRGNTPPFDHRDTNTLRRIAPPTPNPLVGLLKGSKAG